jgi:hypothetical protein
VERLTDRLYAESWQANLGRFRSKFAFRGMQDAAADLSTSLSRLGGNYARQEGHLLRNFRKYAHRDSVPGDSIWNWLSWRSTTGCRRAARLVLLPVRRPALRDAELREFQFRRRGLVRRLRRRAPMLPARLRKLLRASRRRLHRRNARARRGHAAGARPARGRGKPFVAFFEPPSLDDRIVNQFALFSLMSSPTAQMDGWIVAHKQLASKIVIPAALKWEVRDKLDQANINERVLFRASTGSRAC